MMSRVLLKPYATSYAIAKLMPMGSSIYFAHERLCFSLSKPILPKPPMSDMQPPSRTNSDLHRQSAHSWLLVSIRCCTLMMICGFKSVWWRASSFATTPEHQIDEHPLKIR